MKTTKTEQVLQDLKSKARPDQIAGMASYGLTPDGRLGVSIPELRQMAKGLGKDHGLAVELWHTGLAEARILASMVDDPSALTEQQMEEWVAGFGSWDVCDQVCMNLFENSPLAWIKVRDWARRDEEYVKRAGFALLAYLAWHNKQASDGQFLEMVPVLRIGATDGRNYVKKAVSWALRNIGKRNEGLRAAALEAAEGIGSIDDKTARWIAADVKRDLCSEATLRRLAP